jgi:hypothetical protein
MGFDTQAINAIEALTRLAEQFGPFLFALLFIIFVSRTAHGYYAECMARTAPPPTEQETKTYRLYFMSSFAIGVVVMGLSIGWWFYRQAKGNYVYQISIINLEPDEKVISEFYSRTNVRQSIPGIAPNHDALFLVVRDQPYTVGQTLLFEYIKQTPVVASSGGGSNPLIGSGLTPKSIEVKYEGGTLLTYRINNDSAGPRLMMVAQDDHAPATFTADEIARARRIYASAETARR